MKRLRGLIARTDGSTLPGIVGFGEAIESVEAGGGADAIDYIVPGFIDLQINGRGAIDVMNASTGALCELSAELAREGTTAWLATAITSPLARIESVAAKITAAIAAAADTTGTILGMHLEGPFISAARRGAHPAHNLEPRGVALERVTALPALRMITLAPELDGALEAIAALCARGIAVSLGHTDASLEQAQAAVAAGARMFTHTFNAMAPLDHRHPGAAAAATLPSRAWAAVIADGVHVHPAMLRLLYLARGAGGICLTTDRVATGAAAGESPLAAAAVADGAARMPDGRLAGSVISMLDAIRIMVERAGASVGEAALMASTNPARVLGLGERGAIGAGARADLLVLGPGLELKAVFIRGRELA
ncbi:MAG TPA: N-acetylglucosamine-6-phosphate deacetylase [Candidatus Binataceae bacterium]|nr:N-acetylglucosamine-6-phosphate deacetylase [Candidatus Binataceae bacterium]